jgi:hypothetical protein
MLMMRGLSAGWLIRVAGLNRPMYHAAMTSAAFEIQQLRKHRVRQDRDESLGLIMANTADQTRRTQSKLGRLIDLWQQLVPAKLADRTSLVGFHGGVLTVEVDSASTAFQIDRLLRSGLTDELRRRFNGTLSRVRTRIGAPES